MYFEVCAGSYLQQLSALLNTVRSSALGLTCIPAWCQRQGCFLRTLFLGPTGHLFIVSSVWGYYSTVFSMQKSSSIFEYNPGPTLTCWRFRAPKMSFVSHHYFLGSRFFFLEQIRLFENSNSCRSRQEKSSVWRIFYILRDRNASFAS
ncbi:unnamed protein product [Choristocarpus tenellus]